MTLPPNPKQSASEAADQAGWAMEESGDLRNTPDKAFVQGFEAGAAWQRARDAELAENFVMSDGDHGTEIAKAIRGQS